MIPAPTPDTCVVYIAGPMTGYPKHNYPAFDGAADRWYDVGWFVINPADHFDRDTTLPYDEYIRRDVQEIIDHAHALAVLPGWDVSKGTMLEIHLAWVLGLPIYDATTGDPVDVNGMYIRLTDTGANE